jgi:hypothetical protein
MIAISQSQGGRTFGARYRSYSESRCAQPREESPAGETRTSHGEARRELEQECLTRSATCEGEQLQGGEVSRFTVRRRVPRSRYHN